jgi:hypothetical protein
LQAADFLDDSDTVDLLCDGLARQLLAKPHEATQPREQRIGDEATPNNAAIARKHRKLQHGGHSSQAQASDDGNCVGWECSFSRSERIAATGKV